MIRLAACLVLLAAPSRAEPFTTRADCVILAAEAFNAAAVLQGIATDARQSGAGLQFIPAIGKDIDLAAIEPSVKSASDTLTDSISAICAAMPNE